VNDCISKAIRKENKEVLHDKCIHCGHCVSICPVEAVTINGLSGEQLISTPDAMPLYMETLVKKRRSVRHYKNELVSRKKIDKILEVTNCAPTGTNSRSVSISVLDSREKIDELTDIIMRHFDKMTKIILNPITYPFLLIILGRKKTGKLFNYKRMISKYESGNNILTHNAPLLMIFHSHKKSSTPVQDGIIWATTAMYFAESLGIGTCFNGFLVIGINTSMKAKKYLNIPIGHKICETFTAGYPEYSYKRGVIRDDLKVGFV